MRIPSVELRLLSEENLTDLLDTAVSDADPAEVMPPVPGPPGWTESRRRAFRDFHSSRSIATTEPVETTYVIVLEGRVIGAARLEPSGDNVEMGVWIGRSQRAQGIGRLIAADLLTLARHTGAKRIVASTTSDNIAAQRLLLGIGARLTTSGDAIDGELEAHHPRNRSHSRSSARHGSSTPRTSGDG